MSGPTDHDAYGNAVVPPEYTGYEDPEFDGESLVDFLLGEPEENE